MIELIGLLATLFVLVSFLQKSEIGIRKFNIIGASLFIIYGILISSISVWLLNAILLGVHIKRLKELSNEQ
jgi:hypothetical protein|nr:MAG TPA: inner membrane protein [Caudoviricetes sp.]